MTADLEQLENQDFTPGAETEENKPLSPEEILSNPLGQNTEPDGAKPGRFQNLRLKAKANKRNLAIIGGTAGAIGGGMFMFSIIQGPLQFIQMAQLFSSIHNSETEEMTESRLSQALRFRGALSNIDQAEMYRVGWVGRKLTGRLEGFLGNRGITPVYENSVLVDLVDPEGNSIKVGGKTFREIDSDSSLAGRRTANLQRRNFLRKATWQTGKLGKVTAAIGLRPMFRKAGISLRPLGNFRYDSGKSFFENLKLKQEEESAAIRGETDAVLLEGDEVDDADTDGDGEISDAESEAAAAAEAEASSSAEAASELDTDAIRDADIDSDPSTSTKAEFETALRGGTVALLGVSVACAATQLSEASDELQHQQSYMIQLRLAGRFLAIASQIQSGENVDMKELSLLSKQLYDEEKKLGWSSGKSVGMVQGMSEEETEDWPDVPETAKVGSKAEENELKRGLDQIAGFTPDIVCDAFGSTAASVLFFALDPIGEAVETAVIDFLSDRFLDDILRFLSGDWIDYATLFGPDLGNAVNQGFFFLGREGRRNFGGYEMSDQQSGQWRRYLVQQQEQDAIDKGISYRYFALDNPKSLLGTAARSAPTTFSQVASSISNFADNFSSVFGFLKAPFSRVQARDLDASNYDFGVNDIGIPLDTLYDPAYENPYENAQLLKQAITSSPDYSDINDLHEDFGKDCFNLDIVEGAGANPSLTITPLDGIDDDGARYDEISSGKCQRTDTLITRYRFYVLDLMTQESMNCYLGGEDSCEVLLGAEETSDPAQDDDDLANQIVGDASQLATEMLANDSITFNVALARTAIEDTAAGRPAQIESRCTNSPSSEAYINAELLRVILLAAETHTIDVGYFTNGCHGDGSKHYLGKAADINIVDGRSSTGGDADRPFMQELTGILPDGSSMGEVNCSNIPIDPINDVRLHEDTCNHIHIAVP